MDLRIEKKTAPAGLEVTPKVHLRPLIGKDDFLVKDGKKPRHMELKDDNDTPHVELRIEKRPRQLD